jgi:hypothetical protein
VELAVPTLIGRGNVDPRDRTVASERFVRLREGPRGEKLNEVL